jgi:hypothetical protein
MGSGTSPAGGKEASPKEEEGKQLASQMSGSAGWTQGEGLRKRKEGKGKGGRRRKGNRRRSESRFLSTRIQIAQSCIECRCKNSR